MTDEQIIKALERCSQHYECCYCNSVEECGNKRVLTTSTLELIKRQKAEVERLQKEKLDSLNSQFAEMYATTLKIATKKAKAEAVKELVERLVEGRPEDNPVVIAIRCELKEMVGESTTEDSSVTQETRKSKWEIDCDGYYPYCPNCGEEPPSGKMTNFCPKCGKDMRE